MSDLLPTLLLLLTLGTPTQERPDQVLAPTGTGFGQPFDSFGHAVLIGDGELLVGDPQAATVYVFSPSLGQWRITERLSGPGRFGSALRRDGDDLAVTAPAAIDDLVPSGEGEVRFFTPASGAWELTQVLTDGTFGFGRGLSIDGDRALVGSFLPNLAEPGATGRVALFERSADQWQSAGVLFQNSRESSADCPPGGESTGECFVPGLGVSLASADVVLEGAPFAQAATSRFFSASLVGNTSLILGQPSFPNSFRISVDGDRALAVGSGPRAGLADLYRLTNGQWQFERAFQLAGCEITAAALQDAHITLAGPCGIGFFERTAGSWNLAQFVPLDEPTGFRSLSRSDFRLLAGAPSAAGAGGPEAGAIYLLEQSGGAWSVRDRLDAGDGVGADRFGTGVSVAGDWLAVSATDAISGAGFGPVLMHRRVGSAWRPVQSIFLPDARTAREVTLAGELAVVTDQFAQHIHLYRATDGLWTLVAEFEIDTLVSGSGFNRPSTATDGTTVYLAHGHQLAVIEETAGQWTATAVHTLDLAASQAISALSLDADRLLVGAEGTWTLSVSGNEFPPGTAVLYDRSMLPDESARFDQPAGTAGLGYGGCVAAAAHRLAIGAYAIDGFAGEPSGRGYILEETEAGWEISELNAPDGSEPGNLGCGIGFLPREGVVGVRFGTADQEQLLVYRQGDTGWTPVAALPFPSNPALPVDRRIDSIATDGSIAVIGAPRTSVTALPPNSGTVHVFDLDLLFGSSFDG